MSQGSQVSEIKREVMNAIAAADEPSRKVLMLMLLILEDLGGKLDSMRAEFSLQISAMRADEVGLREAVLNGHAGNHDKHHAWVEREMQYSEQHTLDHQWIRQRQASQCAEACSWAATKMNDENKSKQSWRRVFEGTGVNVLTAVAMFVAGAVAMRLLGGL